MSAAAEIGSLLLDELGAVEAEAWRQAWLAALDHHTDTMNSLRALVLSMRLPCQCVWVTLDPDVGGERDECDACRLRGLLGLDTVLRGDT